MLPKNTMVAVRKAIELGYIGVCSVYESVKVKKENGSTGREEKAVYIDLPCKISFSSSPKTKSGERVSEVEQVVKLFLAPEIDIKAGSKICVTQNGKTTHYKNSGEASLYPTHQEILLEILKEWA